MGCPPAHPRQRQADARRPLEWLAVLWREKPEGPGMRRKPTAGGLRGAGAGYRRGDPGWVVAGGKRAAGADGAVSGGMGAAAVGYSG